MTPTTRQNRQKMRWPVRPLLSAVHIANGQVDPKIEPYKSMILIAPDHIESGTGRLIEKKTAADQGAISGKYLFNAGDILYSKIRPKLRKAITVDFDGLCSADMYPLTPASDVSAQFILLLLLSSDFSKFAESVSVRSGIPKINREELAEYSITLPSLPEQRRIVAVLKTWEKVIAKMEQKIEAKRRVKEGLALRLLLGQFSYNKNTKFQKTRFFKIPHDWEVVRIEKIATQIIEKNVQNLELPVLSCTKHFGLVDSLKFFKKQVFSKKLNTYKVVLRDQFVYATNHIEEGSIGLQNLYEAGLVSPMYTVFKTNERILSAYLYALLKTELFRCIFEASTSASVDRRGSLRWKVFQKIEIPLPPTKEQNFIGQILTNADDEISALGKKIDKLKEQKDYLLNHLITGRIRTPENMPIPKA